LNAEQFDKYRKTSEDLNSLTEKIFNLQQYKKLYEEFQLINRKIGYPRTAKELAIYQTILSNDLLNPQSKIL